MCQHNHFQLQAKHLTCYRGERLLINDLSFNVSSGELLQVVGENGSGKTTLLRALTGIFPPQSGEILWQGRLIQRDRLEYQRQFYYLGHQIGVKSELTALENLRLGFRVQADVGEVVSELKLGPLQNILSRHLSRGQRQRVALAKLLLSDASLWILDEPFASLDSVMMDKVQMLLAKKIEKGGGVILTSHRALTLTKLLPRVVNL